MINVNSDTFIEIGSQHKVCEDYILSGDNYIILADGCSSSKNSEMGARILCYMAQQFLKYRHLKLGDEDDFAHRMGLWVIHNAEMTARHLGIKRSCLDATLVVGIRSVDNIYVFMYGDGYIITQDKFGNIRIRWVEYTKNMPFYLRYMIDEDGLLSYHDEKITKTRLIDYENTAHVDRIEVAYDQIGIHAFSLDTYKSVSICSDGVGSFLDPDAEPNSNKIIEVRNLIPEMLGFKTTAGTFLQRRMNKFSKTMKRKGIEHFDDLSMGTFLMEEQDDGQNGGVN
ncbi:protein phosphatase 2C domain-containing protein [Candidatus Pacearchaeota archaeon]|nr:protein phosphatase 2C domain-containing protein [Candidatus Pacearchaeota archaeon]